MITYKVTVSNDATKWYLDGKPHRENGPAVEYANGSKYWYLDGMIHRLDGPAIEYADGSKAWYLDGKCHRVDGPALERTDGYKSWFLEGKPLTEAEHAKRTETCEGKTVEIDGVEYLLVQKEHGVPG